MSSPPQKKPVGLAELLRLKKEKDLAETTDTAETTNPTNSSPLTDPSNPSHSSNTSNPTNTTNPSETSNTTQTSNTSQPSNPAKTTNRAKPPKRSYTSKPSQTTNPANPSRDIAPTRDFMRVANSITREIRAGMFVGKSKQLYDVLYARTRGAIVPKMSAQVPREHLMQAADISSILTLKKNLIHLKEVGLITWQERAGVRGGNEYTVYLPEEAERSYRAYPSHSAETTDTGQKLQGLPGLGTDPSESGVNPTLTEGYGGRNTFSNTLNPDDDAFHQLTQQLRAAAREITGSEPGRNESDRWGEVAQVLVEEMKEAAARTRNVSSAPAFLAAHLRRCFATRKLREDQEPKQSRTRKGREMDQVEDEPGKPDLSKAVEMFKELMTKGDYTIETLTAQFGAGYSNEDWEQIINKLNVP